MKNLKAIILITFLLPLSSGIHARAQNEFSPAFVVTPCEISLPSGEVEGETFLCGYVDVPELHTNPAGKTIRLTVAIIKGHGTAPDPLVMFTGGPGGNVFNLAPVMASATGAPVRENRDIVLMSERGSIGAVPELTCPQVGDALQGHFGEPLAEIRALKLEGFAQCRERWLAEGVNLNAYNNPERAADVPLVMAALGYETYNLWGVSGGGILAMTILRDHPDGVRSLMTDSGAFPDAYIGTVLSTLYENISRAYRLLFETCAADAACNEAYPDLENTFFDLIDKLNADPAPLAITDPVSGASAEFLLNGDTVIALLSNLFSRVTNLPAMMTDLVNGDYTYIASLIPSFYSADADYADALYESVFCSETNQLTQADLSTENAYPQIVNGIKGDVEFNMELCALWEVTPVPASAVIVSDVPILIMEGEYDTNKPPELGEAVAQNFSTSYLALFDATAHGTFGACGIQMMGEFMNDPDQAPDMSCVPTETTFVLDNEVLTFSEVKLDAIGISTVIPDGWTAVDAATYVNPQGDTYLVITAFPGDDLATSVESFAATAGLPSLTKFTDATIGDQVWELYTVTDGGRATMAAFTLRDGMVYVAGIQSPEAEFETVAVSVLRPVVEGISFDK